LFAYQARSVAGGQGLAVGRRVGGRERGAGLGGGIVKRMRGGVAHDDLGDGGGRVRGLGQRAGVGGGQARGGQGKNDLAARARPEFIEQDADEGKQAKTRLDWPSEFKDEVLARLLTLNAERAEAERAAGLTALDEDDEDQEDDGDDE
jgi:hypothetical protein